MEPRADSLVQSVLTPGVTDLTIFSSYDQLMEQLETRINTSRAIYNAFQRSEGGHECSDSYIARGLMAVLRYGKTGGTGINPKGTNDFGYWKVFFQKNVTHADLDAIKDTIEQVDNMNQSLSSVVSFSENTGKCRQFKSNNIALPRSQA